MARQWKVSVLALHGASNTIYANGYMQARVYVEIKAVDSVDNLVYLTPEELKTIQLIDYHTGETLGPDLIYTDRENEFNHSVDPVAISATIANESTEHPASQEKLYWVSAKKVDRRDIGACIKQPDGTTISTQRGTDYDSHDTIIATNPYRYTMDSIATVEKRYTEEGIWRVNFQHALREDHKWKQENFFITSKRHPFKKAEIHECYSDDPETLHNCFCLRYQEKDALRLYYIWDYATEDTKHVGLHKREAKPFWFVDNDATAQIRISQKPEALCLTRMVFVTADLTDLHNIIKNEEPWQRNAWFRFFDVYGNWGDFYVKPSDLGDDFVVSDKN